MDKFADFMNQIPSEIMQTVERRLCSDVAVFKPKTYVSGVEMHSTDYHIIISEDPPPDTYINNRLCRFDTGNITVFNPDDSVLCKESQTVKQYISLLIKPELLSRIANEMDLPGDVRFSHVQKSFSHELLRSIRAFTAETERPDSFTLMLDCMGVQIGALMLRELKSNLRKYSLASPYSKSYIDIAISYMHEYLSANITMDDICKEVNLSPFHFIRIFREKTGLSPHQYLLKLRIDKASELLLSRIYSVSETARICGFINLSHFSKTFRQMTGRSPMDFRNRSV